MAKKTPKRSARGKSKKAPAKAARRAAGSRRAKPAAAPDLAPLREHLVEMLRAGNAHLSFDDAMNGLPAELRGSKPAGFPHTPWQLLEHLRIAQWDILEFSRNPKHVSPEFPAGYWPATEAPPDDAAWEASVESFRADGAAMEALVTSPHLLERLPHGSGQTIAREAMLLAGHNSYHLGQMVLIRRLLGAWKA